MFTSIFDLWASWMRYQRTLYALRGLDARQRADLGLHSDREVQAMARLAAAHPEPVRLASLREGDAAAEPATPPRSARTPAVPRRVPSSPSPACCEGEMLASPAPDGKLEGRARELT